MRLFVQAKARLLRQCLKSRVFGMSVPQWVRAEEVTCNPVSWELDVSAETPTVCTDNYTGRCYQLSMSDSAMLRAPKKSKTWADEMQLLFFAHMLYRIA